MTLPKLAAIASFLLPVAWIAPFLIYLSANLETPLGPVIYGLADALYGPIWAVCMVIVFRALQAQFGESAPLRSSLAMSTTWLAVAAMVCVACIRSANRQYHLAHPALQLENSAVVLSVWATLVAGVTGAGWHFLGWSFLLLAWEGWTTRRIPRVLSMVSGVTGVVSLVVYSFPELEGSAMLCGIVASVGLGLHFWRTAARHNQISAPTASPA